MQFSSSWFYRCGSNNSAGSSDAGGPYPGVGRWLEEVRQTIFASRSMAER